MSLKSLIQRLLDSRTTPAQAANASKPVSGIPVEYSPSPSIGTWGQVLSDSIAVSDGYIWATGRTSAIGGFLQVNSQAMQSTTTGTPVGEGEMLSLVIPISKGQVFVVYARSLNEIAVRLVKTIGGGYNLIVRRALPCLRPSFNFSLKNSLLAEATGFPINPIRQLPRRISHHQKQAIGLQLSPHAMDGSVLKLGLHKFCSATENFGRGHRRQLLPTWDFQCLSQKAGQWRMCCHKTQQNRSPSLFQALAIRANLLAGGMTC